MDVQENPTLINITWRYSNPSEGYDVWLKLFVKDRNQTVFWRTVDATEGFCLAEGEFNLDVEYELGAEILEGTLTETQLPILTLGDKLKVRNGKPRMKSTLYVLHVSREHYIHFSVFLAGDICNWSLYTEENDPVILAIEYQGY